MTPFARESKSLPIRVKPMDDQTENDWLMVPFCVALVVVPALAIIFVFFSAVSWLQNG